MAQAIAEAIVKSAVTGNGQKAPNFGQPGGLNAPATTAPQPAQPFTLGGGVTGAGGYQVPTTLNALSGGKLQNNVSQVQQNIAVLKKLFGG
jgi:hypothetical protein